MKRNLCQDPSCRCKWHLLIPLNGPTSRRSLRQDYCNSSPTEHSSPFHIFPPSLHCLLLTRYGIVHLSLPFIAEATRQRDRMVWLTGVTKGRVIVCNCDLEVFALKFKTLQSKIMWHPF
jgi:hypothetical protein